MDVLISDTSVVIDLERAELIDGPASAARSRWQMRGQSMAESNVGFRAARRKSSH